MSFHTLSHPFTRFHTCPFSYLSGKPLHTRQLLYTAVTRAKQLLLIIATRQAINNCLAADVLKGGMGGVGGGVRGGCSSSPSSWIALRVAEAVTSAGLQAEVQPTGPPVQHHQTNQQASRKGASSPLGNSDALTTVTPVGGGSGQWAPRPARLSRWMAGVPRRAQALPETSNR